MNLQNIPKGEKNITTYLREVKYVLDQLSVAGKPLDVEEMNAIVFCNLGFEYSDIIAALSTKSEPVPFHELHHLLLSHEACLTVANRTIEANLSHASRGNTYSSGDSNGQPSYLACSPSPGSYPNQQHGNNSKNKGRRERCQIYKKNNYNASTCRFRYAPSSVQPAANMAGILPTPQPSMTDWFPDIAANHHITPDLSNLHISSEYKGKDSL